MLGWSAWGRHTAIYAVRLSSIERLREYGRRWELDIKVNERKERSAGFEGDSMIGKLKRSLKKVLPARVVARISADRWWKFLWKAGEGSGLHKICRKLISANGVVVRWGPFAGLKLPPRAILASSNCAALVGTYEMELHPWLESLGPGKYDRLLDIGSAEGYYAIGMALRTESQVDAFDTASVARGLCRETATLNDVSHLVRVHSFCSRRVLLGLAGLRCFILSDCEGYETRLFSEEVIDALSRSDFVIELHDGAAPAGTTRELLKTRFRATHHVEVVNFRPRDLSSFPDPALAEMLGADAIRAISEEGRLPDQEWLVAIALHKGSSGISAGA